MKRAALLIIISAYVQANKLRDRDCYDPLGNYVKRCSEYECCGTFSSFKVSANHTFSQTACIRPEFHNFTISGIDNDFIHSFEC